MSPKKNRPALALSALATILLSGCGFAALGPSEHGVVFSAMPVWLGGGLENKVIGPGEKEFVLPWETLYRFETSQQSIAWGGVGRGEEREVEDYVETRASDGNEVGLAVTIIYRLLPEKIPHLVQNVAVDDKQVFELMASVSRADIRTHMNVLKTRDFFNPEDRQRAVDQVRSALNSRLNPEGIVVEKVVYNEHRFERRISEKETDRTYQEQIDRTQALNQQTEQEEKKVKSVIEAKRREFNEAQARVNRQLEEAEGYKRQATLRGDGYLEAKKNEAEQVRTVGKNEVEGLKKQIEALSGPGGEALLRLTLVKELIAGNPKFVVVNSADGKKLGLDLNKMDLNNLFDQIGVSAPKPDSKGKEGSSPVITDRASTTSSSGVEQLLEGKISEALTTEGEKK